MWIAHASTWDLPSPPNSSGIVQPATPSSPARRACRSGSKPGSVSSAVRSSAQDNWSVRTARRVSCWAGWSSLRSTESRIAMRAAPHAVRRLIFSDEALAFRANLDVRPAYRRWWLTHHDPFGINVPITAGQGVPERGTEMTELVRYEADEQVATVTLDSPHNRNALSAQLVMELTARLDEAGADEGVRAVVLTHTGRVFCSGADLAA